MTTFAYCFFGITFIITIVVLIKFIKLGRSVNSDVYDTTSTIICFISMYFILSIQLVYQLVASQIFFLANCIVRSDKYIGSIKCDEISRTNLYAMISISAVTFFIISVFNATFIMFCQDMSIKKKTLWSFKSIYYGIPEFIIVFFLQFIFFIDEDTSFRNVYIDRQSVV